MGTEHEAVDIVQPAEDAVSVRGYREHVKQHSGFQNSRKFLETMSEISFSQRTRHHGLNYEKKFYCL
jgi:hypothetical protein